MRIWFIASLLVCFGFGLQANAQSNERYFIVTHSVMPDAAHEILETDKVLELTKSDASLILDYGATILTSQGNARAAAAALTELSATDLSTENRDKILEAVTQTISGEESGITITLRVGFMIILLFVFLLFNREAIVTTYSDISIPEEFSGNNSHSYFEHLKEIRQSNNEKLFFSGFMWIIISLIVYYL